MEKYYFSHIQKTSDDARKALKLARHMIFCFENQHDALRRLGYGGDKCKRPYRTMNANDNGTVFFLLETLKCIALLSVKYIIAYFLTSVTFVRQKEYFSQGLKKKSPHQLH